MTFKKQGVYFKCMWTQTMTATPTTRLKGSKWRSSFALSDNDRTYIKEKGLLLIEHECRDILTRKLSNPTNDGKQTPYRGHPVFVAQHATATWCRKCLERVHGIARNGSLPYNEISAITKIVITWITAQLIIAKTSSRLGT